MSVRRGRVKHAILNAARKPRLRTHRLDGKQARNNLVSLSLPPACHRQLRRGPAKCQRRPSQTGLR